MSIRERRRLRITQWLALAMLASFAMPTPQALAEDLAATLRGALIEDGAPTPLEENRKRPGGAAQIETAALKSAATDAGAQEKAALRGTLGDDRSSTAVIVGFAVGYTTNAGPSLDKKGSGVTRTTAEMLHVFERDGQQVSLKGAFADRQYIGRPDVSEMQHAVSAAYAGTLKAGALVSASLKSERRVDVDEHVDETALSLGYEWPKAAFTPFVQVLGAYLDYGAITGDFLEFGNQDDRDRFSGTAQAGLKYDVASKLAVRFGAGVDIKRYMASYDDFGLMRDSTSVFPFAGVSYADGEDAADLVYAPVYRSYRETGFSALLAHTLTARGQVKVNAMLKLFGAARMGLEETDFFIAKTIQEYVVSAGGVVTTAGGLSAGLEIAYTMSDFMGVDRVDHKLEAVLKTKAPLSERFHLTGEAKYLDFKSNFAGARTDMLMGMIGVAYEYGQ